MCVTSPSAELYPVTTNVGVGQCAGAEGAGAEICMPRRETSGCFVPPFQVSSSVLVLGSFLTQQLITTFGLRPPDAHAPQHTLIPASIAAAAEGGDDNASFDLLFATGNVDYTPCEDMQMVMQEFVADPEGRSVALRHLKEVY